MSWNITSWSYVSVEKCLILCAWIILYLLSMYKFPWYIHGNVTRVNVFYSLHLQVLHLKYHTSHQWLMLHHHLLVCICVLYSSTYFKTTLNAKCSIGEKFHIFCTLWGNYETFMPENGLTLLNFKQFMYNTMKLFCRNTNVHAIHETFPPRNILHLRYVVLSWLLY